MAANDRSEFRPSKSLSLYYERSLRKIARNIGDIASAVGGNAQSDPIPLMDALARYSNVLEPWAESIAERMVKDTERANTRQWKAHAATMGRELRHEIENTDTGIVMDQLIAEQVRLIKSLPLDAAQRVQRIARESLITGARYDELRDELLRTGDVSKARATLIARTESSRASTILTQARATAIGSPGYIWRSHRDKRTRPTHKAMNGQFVAWDDPPTIDGYTFHAGAVFNCRCHPMPILPE